MSYFSEQNPYQPPYQTGYSPPAPMPPAGTPGVWYGYVAYCIFMALLYGLCVLLGMFFIVASDTMADGPQQSPMEFIVVGAVMVAMGGVLGLMYVIPLILPRTKGAWIYGFVTIGIGMTSACTLPFAIALLIFWLQPNTKAFFHVA